ncbi:MAG: Rpn family recombination-promoting nuclease/putative transposase [Clostridiales bacterium]|nr:Rpn family recombination-promoting nuclease/putative transposase [Clostridiales bacterium]
MEQRKSLRELTLLDRFLFNETMEIPENMQALLEIILGKEIVLKYLPQSEKEQRISPLSRFVKLDVWVQDEENVIYEVESQRKNTGNLPKRSRYYQSMIDSRLLEPGIDDFNELNPVYVIIITPFDLFKKKKCCYTFSMTCEEVSDVYLNDGAVRIFLNTHGEDDKDISPELKELLYFIEHTNDQGKIYRSDKVNGIRKSVRTIQNNEEVNLRYMQEWEEKLMFKREGLQEGREEGRKEGIKEGRKEGIEETQKKMQPVIDEAERRLREVEEEKNKIKQEAYEQEVQTFLNLLKSGFSQEKVRSYTNSGEDIVKEALERLRAKPV